ncbi:MAG TPA: OmpA family protein [Stellaceae bacterium]|nr:OmpA family protein [Stellaceae bacterium]
MRNKLGLVIFGVAVVGLTGCSYVPDAVNPVSWYRDLSGASKNDKLGNGENQQNLDEGGNEPYPNLASVPAEPDTQLSGVDRDKLVDSLIADRQNAQYSADNLRAGEVANNVPPPAPPATAAKSGTSSNASTVTASAAAAPSPSPANPPPAANPAPAAAAAPPAQAPTTAQASPTPQSSAAAAAPPAQAPTTAAQASPASQSPAAASPNPANRANPPGPTARRLPPRGSEAPPPESSLQSPSIPNVPQGEAAMPAPPPPHIAPPPNQVASAAPPAAATRAPLLHPPTQTASAPASAPATAPASHSAISYRVADVSFAPGSAYLSGALRGTIAEVVKLHNAQGGRIRIVGFGEATGQDAAVAGLTLALDRAQAVAVALTDSGVAAKDISVEAAPVPARGGADAPRAEIYLEQ